MFTTTNYPGVEYFKGNFDLLEDLVTVLLRYRYKFKLCNGGVHWGLRDYGSERFFLRFYGIFDSQLRDCGFIQYDGTRYFSILSRCVR